MATKYLLGQKAARFLHEAMNESPVGRRLQAGKVSAALEFAAPWTLRYSAAVYISGSGSSELRGGWIIWLPPGSIAGYSVDEQSAVSFSRPLTPEDDNMPEGWWLLSSELSTALNQSGEHSLYADIGLGGIVLRTTHGLVHVADVIVDGTSKAKNVKQIARSVVTVVPKPFDICYNGSSYVIERQYYNVGAKTYEAGVSASGIAAALPCIVALKIGLTGGAPTTQLVTASGISGIQQMQTDENFAVVPLYQLDVNGNIMCDFRSGVIAVAGEF